MNNKKKLLSIITALAITASAFTGFAVTASATETPIVSYTFDETSDAAWEILGANADVFTKEIVSDDASVETKWDSKYYKIATTKAQSGGRTASVKIPATIKLWSLEFLKHPYLHIRKYFPSPHSLHSSVPRKEVEHGQTKRVSCNVATTLIPLRFAA